MSDDARIQLLLADARDGRPVLEDGLPGEAASAAPKPESLPRRADNPKRRARDRAPDDLREQRWGVIVPEGPQGERLLAALRPLIAHREEEQGAAAVIHRVRPAMSSEEALAWRDQVYLDEAVPEPDRPGYLLLAGHPREVSFELQHVMAHEALVGRLGFDDERGYEAYASKAVRWARGSTPHATPDLTFYVARDGSAATRDGERLLARPLVDHLGAWRVPTASRRLVGPEGARRDDLLASARGSRPSLLLTLSHGEGPPPGGWKGAAEQRARQGALSLGNGERLGADAVRSGPFLPGGAWICVACFSAGTPSSSVFLPWLTQLADLGELRRDQLGQVVEGLPAEGPFVAALPQAALANPEGPLAFLGHVDLSWTHGFASADFAESRASRILRAVKPLAQGSRAGVAFEALMDVYRTANVDLTESYQIQAGLPPGAAEDPARRRKRGHLWMLRNELRGYVLLGDPAARLPLHLDEPPPQRSAGPAPAPPEVAAREAAVVALWQGDEAPRAIAARAGVPVSTLWSWFDAYRAGGRARL